MTRITMLLRKLHDFVTFDDYLRFLDEHTVTPDDVRALAAALDVWDHVVDGNVPMTDAAHVDRISRDKTLTDDDLPF